MSDEGVVFSAMMQETSADYQQDLEAESESEENNIEDVDDKIIVSRHTTILCEDTLL